MATNQSATRTYSPFWHRPARAIAVAVGLAAGLVSLLLEQKGIRWKYSEVVFGTVMVLWLLLTGFRPEWHRLRYWLVMAGITAAHLTVWLFLASRVDRFGFGMMFLLVVAELVLGATVISKAIPEDEQVMLDYIARW